MGPRPRRCCSSTPLPGAKWSGVDVASTMASMSPRARPDASMARRLARSARSTPVSPSRTQWRWRMPVRCAIHSSVVSMTAARSSLVTMRSGTAMPVPRMRLRVMRYRCGGGGRAGRCCPPVHRFARAVVTDDTRRRTGHGARTNGMTRSGPRRSRNSPVPTAARPWRSRSTRPAGRSRSTSRIARCAASPGRCTSRSMRTAASTCGRTQPTSSADSRATRTAGP